MTKGQIRANSIVRRFLLKGLKEGHEKANKVLKQLCGKSIKCLGGFFPLYTTPEILQLAFNIILDEAEKLKNAFKKKLKREQFLTASLTVA